MSEEESNGPVFYSDLWAVMQERQQNPNLCVLISLEQDNDPQCKSFWSTKGIYLLLKGKAKVIRLCNGRDSVLFNQFTEFYPVKALPTISVFGPYSKGPSFSFVTNLPTLEEFYANFKSLNISSAPAPQPVNNSPIRIEIPENEDPILEMRNKTKKPTLPTPSPPIEKKEPKTITRAISQPSVPKRVGFTAHLPTGNQITRAFSMDESINDVYQWVSKYLLQKTDFKLFVLPSLEPFSEDKSQKVSLYSPQIAIKVVLQEQPFVMPNIGGFFSRFFGFLSDFSIFASSDDDPYDFWRTTADPVPQENQRRQAPRYIRDGNINRINPNFRADQDNQRNMYNNGNNTTFQ